jgi:hypothetical protein
MPSRLHYAPELREVPRMCAWHGTALAAGIAFAVAMPSGYAQAQEDGNSTVRATVDNLPVAATGTRSEWALRSVAVEVSSASPLGPTAASLVSVQKTFRAGPADWSVGVGAIVYDIAPAMPRLVVSGRLPWPSSEPSLLRPQHSEALLLLGLRWQTFAGLSLYAAAAARPWRAGSDALLGKMGVEFKTAQSRWNIGFGGFGLRLDGDTKLTLRLRHGGLGVAMKRAF